MGRRWYPHLIPDIEMLDDAEGCFVIITLYPDGRLTVSEVDSKAEPAN